jgi:hypothetical protein
MKETQIEHVLAFRVTPDDLTDLDRVCAKLDLQRSEIARRALREGLKLFRDVSLPGVAQGE